MVSTLLQKIILLHMTILVLFSSSHQMCTLYTTITLSLYLLIKYLLILLSSKYISQMQIYNNTLLQLSSTNLTMNSLRIKICFLNNICLDIFVRFNLPTTLELQILTVYLVLPIVDVLGT